MRVLRRLEVPLLLGWIVAVHLAVNLLWLRQDTLDVLRAADGHAHAVSLLQLLTWLDLGGVSALPHALRELHSYYPVMAHLPLALVGLLLEPTALVLRAANALYLIVLLVGVYGVGVSCHGRRAGLLAAALVSLMPAVYGGARTIGLDFPALCVTPLAILCLLRSDGLRDLRWAALCGICTGLAALAKGQALLFLAWPVAFVAAIALWEGRRERSLRPLLGSAVVLGALLATTSIWWAGRLGYLWRIMQSHATGEGMMFYEGDISLLGGVLHYLRTFPFLVGGVLAVGLLALLPAFWRGSRQRLVILCWLLLPLVLHIVLKVRHHRYLFPLVPAVAVILGVGLSSLRPRLRGLGSAALTVGAAVLWLTCSFARSGPLAAVPGEARTCPWTCGDLAYAGPPLRPSSLRTAAPAERVARFLEARHPRGRGAMLYFFGEHELVQLVALVQTRLPALRLTEDANPGFLRYRPPRTWQRYVLRNDETTHPAGTAREVLRTEAELCFPPDPVRRFPLILWQLDADEPWPPPEVDRRQP
jgi:4-amino-4-deoxy-L-arabinose transferase-like glycosyltransferase